MAELRAGFWEKLSLEELNQAEWEALCDGCARCCLVKLEEEETGRIYFTRLVCSLLDEDTCRCSDYANRREKIADCRKISLASLREIEWLPPDCAYLLRQRGEKLPAWHPLVSGSTASVHEAGFSTKGWTISEKDIEENDYEDYLVAAPFGNDRKKCHDKT